MFLGERRPSAAKDITYEAGSDPVGDPRARFPVRFYPLAILFVVFDIEAAFFYPWAVNFRELSCAGALRAGADQARLSKSRRGSDGGESAAIADGGGGEEDRHERVSVRE